MKTVFRLGALIGIFMGGLLIVATVSRWWAGRDVANWSSVEGVITVSDIITYPNKGDPAMSDKGVYIEYGYSVNGKDYTSTTVSYSYGPSGTMWNLKLAERFKKGRMVQVYYNPDSPEDACLIPAQSELLPVAGAVIMGAAMIFLCAYGLMYYL